MRWDSRVAIYYWGHPKDGQYASSFFIFYYYIPFFILPGVHTWHLDLICFRIDTALLSSIDELLARISLV